MNKSLLAYFIGFYFFIFFSLSADEGMWMLPLIKELNIDKMQSMGLALSADDIYNINEPGLKDAVVIFGGGCTAGLISEQGLLLTNHHCGFSSIQKLSSVEDNYLEDGVWASGFEDEMPVPDLSVTFLMWMEDVSSEVLSVVSAEMQEADRNKAINKKIIELIEEAEKDSDFFIEIEVFFEGTQYFMLAYQDYYDIRLVGAPPLSIGSFGHDADNWMWPRHTGDFALFRIYTDAEGNPAEYSPDNIPLQSKHFFPISLKGYEQNDFAMVLGYPGSTERYLTSWGIEERMNNYNQALITVRGEKQEIWAESMALSDEVKLQYAGKYSSSSNYWKNSIGMNLGLENLDIQNKKRELEREFSLWLNEDSVRMSTYGSVLTNLQYAYERRADHDKAMTYLVETLLGGTELLIFASYARELENAFKQNDEDFFNDAIYDLWIMAEDFYEDYHAPTDKKVMAAMLKRYAEDIDSRFHPSFYQEVPRRIRGDYQKMAEYFFSKSIFVDYEKFYSLLEKPSLRKLKKDPIYKAGLSVLEKYRELLFFNLESETKIAENERLFISGLKEMFPEKIFYPDANFTMRLSYGTVGDYEPRDAVLYKHYTTIEGLMDKEDVNDPEFHIPEKLKQLYVNRDFGQYASDKGQMVINFITNNDITGGNSGSPVLNGNGELIGVAFDGNWEAMSGDIAFEPELQKCINVDIRYILYIIDKYAGAGYLLDEMILVK